MPKTPAILEPTPPAKTNAPHEVPFGVNEMRLSATQWLIALAIVTAFIIFTPRIWKKTEAFSTTPDYRIPYQLSKDYWLYQRRLDQDATSDKVFVLGDSVIWGEYVLPDGTLPHFLSQQTNRPFLNCGVNGLFPLAMEGLVNYYADSLRGKKVILHCNVLWMTSPKADLSIPKEETFNHSRLVPQFRPRIPCYRADVAERLSVLFERNIGFLAWVGHLQNAYCDQRSIPGWTLVDDGDDPPHCPNAFRNPLKQITMTVPSEQSPDPLRGPSSPRHHPWTEGGAEPMHFDWVDLDASLQWAAFNRSINLLRSRGNDVLVILGPFNEHMIAPDQRPRYRAMCDAIAAHLADQHIPCIAPPTLASDLYADASHPLTQGYALLARQIYTNPAFTRWLGK